MMGDLFVIGLGIFLGLLALAFLGMAFVDQRKLWWNWRARWYRNPEANEPSDLALGRQRLSFVAAAAMMAFATYQVLSAGIVVHDESKWSQDEVRAAAEQAGRDLESSPKMQHDAVDVGDVELALPNDTEFAAEEQLTVEESGADSYVISAEGQYPQCLTLKTSRGSDSITVPNGSGDGAETVPLDRIKAEVAQGAC
ncbi:hypothetical protein G5C51_01970 [Streptomyces sp. A7024]|uniref:Uncharacterized protein n=1 Tax=Streptomyces coryli TaxID=1128680 RepID=A0A6G4TUK5_9ACTN|nr:hypothetical protein [Streptomyces coryli]NGN62671.1 hypothetical protein [Streptomyces coryli]